MALGVGSAVAMGFGCGVAAADPTDSSTSSTKDAESKTPEKSAPKPKKPDEKVREARENLENFGSKVRTAVRDALDSAGAKPVGDEDRPTTRATRRGSSVNRAPKQHRVERAPAKAVERQEPENLAPQVEPDKPEAAPQVTVAVERITDIPRSVLPAVPRVSAKAPEPVATTPAQTVSTVIGAMLNPFSVNSLPDTPTEPPAAWALLAAARREFERAVRQPENLLSSVSVIQQVETPIGLAPGIVVPPELIDHVVVTPGPSLTDQITVFGMEALKQVSQVIGVNITMKLGELITTPTPPWFTTIGLDVTKDSYEGGDVWVITPPNPTGERVIAVHGSGFVYNPNIIHWMDYAQMARQTGATIVVPRYPLIPDGGTAENSVPAMADFIANEVETYGAENVSIYADSAGGTLSALAVQKIVRDCNGDSACLENRVPSRMVLISPGLSGEEIYTDPNVELVNDPVVWLTEEDKEYYGQWASGPEEIWNPMIGPTDGMPPTTIYVGSREQAAPGALRYAERMVDADPNADVTVVIGMGQIHNWAQGGPIPINSQAANYRDDVYRQLGLVDEAVSA
ncbi:alpha/beta hydrolase fold domain-containing protein [Mycolicibacterium sp. XJ870]